MNISQAWPHYKIQEIKSILDVRAVFAGETNFNLNWVFISTSGVHGSTTTLDELEAAWDLQEDHNDFLGHHITILIVHPRLVVMRYGEIEISREDIPWLRDLVAKTLDAVPLTQAGNLPPAGV